MNTEQKEFCDKVYNALVVKAPQYNMVCYSAIIAQAVIESNWGKSELSTKYNNFFGMKCGSAWTGKSVNMTTHEEYNGNNVIVKDNFRVYDTFEDGIDGYLDFTNTQRYSNLKGVKDPLTFLTLIKSDGYATSSSYVDTVMNIVTSCNLTIYDTTNANAEVDYTQIAREVIAGKYGNGNERRTLLASAGYDYDKVQAMVNTLLSNNPTNQKTNEEIATEVIRGKWGNGSARKQNLASAGYDYEAIMKIVNARLK